ncbi:MAG: SpaA isopeptide-forming pilin-related protein, partial [Oliverpabstia sp.]|nr:SpaA isopeptide-forming pilin-related protein [Oliverpabstia sp.]
MKNRAFRKFVASIGVAAMVMSTATNALSPAVTRAESAQELEGRQNDSQEQGGQEDPVAQSSDDTNGAPFADAEPMAVSSEGSQDSQGAAGPSESSDSNGENGTEGSSGENTNASAGGTSTDASGAGSQDATGTMSGATNGTAGTTNSTITGTTNDTAGTINGATDTFANGTSTDASTGTTTGENGEASGDDAEASTKEITSVITEDIDLGTYFAGDAPAYAQLELPDEIEVKVDEEKQTVTVTWNGEETYHPDQAGTYIFSSELDKEWNKDENGNARYQLAEKVELPKASVRVEKKAESTEDSKAEVKSDNKTENKTDAKLDIKEDKKTDAKADNKPEGKTEEKSDNKSEVTTKPETTKETTKDTSKENTKETSKKDSASKDKTKDETEDEAKNEAKEENKTATKDETAKADQKKKITNAASLKAVYVAEDGTILCGTVGLTGDSFTISDKAKSFNGYELKAVTLGEEELPQDTAFTRNTSTTETKEEIRTEASYTYTMDGAEHEIAAGDTATITFTYAQKEEVTPEIASIEVTGEAVDTTGAAIQGDYAFPLAVGTNDLSKTAPYMQGYEYQYAEIGTDKITSIAKEVLEAGKYAYFVDGELLKENTKITYVYQEDEDYTEQLSADCGDVSVTLSATKDAKIPKNAKLVVNAITGDRLRSALSMSADAMGVTADKVYGTAYDIYLEADGNRIQPSEHVHVTMSFHNPVSLNLPDKAQVAKSAVIHIHDGSASEVSGTAETDGSSVTGAEFDADSFSIYVNAYTVDFHYNGLTYSMKGNGAVKLSEVMKAVDIQEDVAEVKSAVFTNPELLKVEKDTEGNDWTLTSLQSFTSDEILTVTMEDGTVYTIAVTDPEKASGTEDISGLISKVELYQEGSSTPVQGNEWNVKANTDYRIWIVFSEETNNTQKQFPDSGKMHYQLPGNISISNHEGTGTIEASDSQGKFSLPYSYSIDKNGKITITLDSSHADYQRFQSCGDASLYVDLSAKFTASESNQISFGPVTKTVKVDSKANLDVTKSGTYDPKTNKTTYTVTVTSTGYNENVEVQDTITGSLLTFDGIKSITASSTRETDNSLSNIVKEENGFKVTIPFMKDGETITLKYTASVDLTKLNGNSTGDSEDETGNKVSVKHTNDEKPQQEKEFHHSVGAYTSISKNVGKQGIGQVQSENVNGETRYYRVIPWTIEYNQDRYVSVAGNTITDTITTTTPPMSYTDDGIEIQITNEDGTTGETRNVKWKDLQANGSVNGWQYTIPKTDGKFGYTITYNTKVDVTDIITSQTVKNDVSDGKGHIAHGAPSVGPRDENKVDLAKTGTADATQANWTITISVPAAGLSEAVLIDTLPNRWKDNVLQIDKYLGNLNVDNAPENTSWDVICLDKDQKVTEKTEDARYVKVVFYQDKSKTTQGISGNGNSITNVIVTLSTKFDDNWKEGDSVHQNKVELNGIIRTADVSPESSGVKKQLNKDNNHNPRVEVQNDKSVLTYYFDIYFYGVKNGNIQFGDTFDKKHLKLLSSNAYILSGTGNNDWDLDWNNRINCSGCFTETENGFSFSIKNLPWDKNKNPKGMYRVTYALYVDPDNIGDLNALAALTSGKYKFSNSMESSAGSSSVSFDYTHPTLSKTDTVSIAEDRKSAIAHFTIVANPEGFTMNGDQNLTLTDKIIKNLSVDYSSIKVTPEDALVKYTSSGDTITFIIKDSKKATITYDAKVLTPGEFSNSATLQGETVIKTDSASFTNSSGGTASNPSIKIIKVDQDNEAIKLEGAEFGLYTDSKATQPVQYLKQNNENAVFVTDSKGEATIIGDAHTKGWTLEKNKTYYLKELKAPAGYEINTTIYHFTISLANQPDYLNYIYYDGDELTVKDKKIPTSADLKVKKIVRGEGYTANEDFSFSLSPESNAPMPEGSTNGSKTVSVKNNGEANFGTI